MGKVEGDIIFSVPSMGDLTGSLATIDQILPQGFLIWPRIPIFGEGYAIGKSFSECSQDLRPFYLNYVPDFKFDHFLPFTTT